MITLREVIDTEQENEELMFANSPCICKLLLYRFQDNSYSQIFILHFILLSSRLQSLVSYFQAFKNNPRS